jgi:hypothetical protein
MSDGLPRIWTYNDRLVAESKRYDVRGRVHILKVWMLEGRRAKAGPGAVTLLPFCLSAISVFSACS